MKKLLAALLLNLLFIIGYSQNKKQVLEIANNSFESGHYNSTVEILDDFTKAYPDELNSLFLLSKAYFELHNYEASIKLLKKIYNKDRDRNYPKASYLLAQSYQHSGNYRYAKRYYQRAITPYRRKKESYEYERITQQITACNFGLNNQKKSYNFIPLSTEVNTNDADYGFTKIDASTAIFSSVASSNGKLKSKLYIAEKVNNRWGSKHELHVRTDTALFQLANPFYDQPTNRLYFSICDTNRVCDIVYADYNTNNPLIPFSIEEIKIDQYTNTQPTIANINNGIYLIFSSNRPEGKGGLDLWCSKIENNKFNAPFNLKQINSKGNELSPFYHAENLYFSSDWYNNLGGFDVFKITTDLENNFEKIENLIEVNSPLNDLYFSIYDTTYYLTSNRKGALSKSNDFCCNDIFYFHQSGNENGLFKDTLQSVFPLTLYFDNDQPKSNGRFDISAFDYFQLLKTYRNQRTTYLNKAKSSITDQDDLEDFFDWQLLNEDKLQETFDYLKLQLKNGDTIQLLVQGFSSSLADKEYNYQLSERRINSFIQSIIEYDNGLLKEYLDSKQLLISKEALGEGNIDRINNDQNTIYSIEAIMERKIEVKAQRLKKSNCSN